MRARSISLRTQPVDAAKLSGDVTIGRLTGFDPEGKLLVEVPGVPEVQTARSLLRLDRALRQAVLRHAEVALLFEGGDRSLPIVAGVLQPTAAEPVASEITELAPPGPALALEVDADGQRVKLTAQDEIVLECGQSSIILRRNGRVIIQGVQVDSIAAGTHRIRGGQVRLN